MVSADLVELRSAVRLLSGWADEMSADPGTPGDLQAAIKQINILRDRLSESGRITNMLYAKVSKLETERTVFLRQFEALREVLGTFAERGDGWFQSSLVCREDYNSWAEDAKL